MLETEKTYKTFTFRIGETVLGNKYLYNKQYSLGSRTSIEEGIELAEFFKELNSSLSKPVHYIGDYVDTEFSLQVNPRFLSKILTIIRNIRAGIGSGAIKPPHFIIISQNDSAKSIFFENTIMRLIHIAGISRVHQFENMESALEFLDSDFFNSL